MAYVIDDFYNMRGFEALTQGEKRIEDMLVKKANDLKGKVRGFNATRLHCLNNEFDDDALNDFIELSKAVSVGVIELSGAMTSMGKNLLEKIFRHHVPLDMVSTFADAYHIRFRKSGVDAIKKYFTCGRVVPVAQSYREALEEIEKGDILYYEPN